MKTSKTVMKMYKAKALDPKVSRKDWRMFRLALTHFTGNLSQL